VEQDASAGANFRGWLANDGAGNYQRDDAKRRLQPGDEQRDVVGTRGRWRPFQHQHALLVDDALDDGVVEPGKPVRSGLLSAAIVN